MNLAIFKACLAGYQDRLDDYQILAVVSGFWSGYYSNAKKPKSLKSVIDKIVRGKSSTKKQPHADTVDVQEFLRKEAEFKKKLSNRG